MNRIFFIDWRKELCWKMNQFANKLVNSWIFEPYTLTLNDWMIEMREESNQTWRQE